MSHFFPQLSSGFTSIHVYVPLRIGAQMSDVLCDQRHNGKPLSILKQNDAFQSLQEQGSSMLVLFCLYSFNSIFSFLMHIIEPARSALQFFQWGRTSVRPILVEYSLPPWSISSFPICIVISLELMRRDLIFMATLLEA